MPDYYISSSNSTFFLSGSTIYSSDGSGSGVDKTDSTEMTFNWFANQQNITVIELLEISTQVSGSRTYIHDNGWV
tara:strand:- start:39 stop:263 length:225 start_codon:yes stop_codon:yes gene_type:complete